MLRKYTQTSEILIGAVTSASFQLVTRRNIKSDEIPKISNSSVTCVGFSLAIQMPKKDKQKVMDI